MNNKDFQRLFQLRLVLDDVRIKMDEIIDEAFCNHNEKPRKVKKQLKMITLDDCVISIAKKLKMSDTQVRDFLNNILEVYPTAAVQVLLKAASQTINSRYDDDLSNYAQVYIVSTVDTAIYPLATDKVMNFGTIAYFRTLSDASEARNAVQELLKEIITSEDK